MSEEDWDIEEYRNQFEPEEQWELKKKFMETHKGTFPEDRVVCLAQVLVNIEFLGTKYPDETMKTVAELSQDIIGEFRERQKNRLQRTFVGAADAANAKYQGKSIPKTNTLSHIKETSSVLNQSQPLKGGKRKHASAPNEGASVTEKRTKNDKDRANNNGVEKNLKESNNKGSGSLTGGAKSKPYFNPKLILTYLKRELEKPVFPFNNVIRESTRLANVKLETTTEQDKSKNQWVSSVIFDGTVIATAVGESKSSLRSAFQKAFESLKEKHYQLVIAETEATSVFTVLSDAQDELEMMDSGLKKDTVSKNGVTKSDSESASPAAESKQSSVAMKMMKMMGWTAGSGLGAQKQGITEPIKTDVVIGRSGFGSKTDPDFKNAIRAKLQEYASSNALYKLTFTNEFTSEQRAVIHELARTMGLKTKSVGTKSNRLLTVRRPGSASTPEILPFVQRLQEMKEAHPLFSKAELIFPSKM